MAARRALGSWVIIAGLLAGCTSGPPAETAAAILDQFEEEGLVACRERREPLPDLITCEDDEDGDITVVFTDTEEDSIRSSSNQTDGPWILGSGFIVVSYDNDPARLAQLRDVLGTGDLVGVDDDGNPVPLEE
ncbi:hypothetical protein [Euzebya tangerina]|uniref:hypothetical protein n=1 Tax=Euzebya tangerina TaxID=591198 RepID=UPI000E32304D|nr:hypothetical protein [Euzebya tangerina]